MTPLLRPVTKMKCSMPASLASSTTYWISGLSTMVSISLGIALVAGRTRVPRPATGKTALRIFMGLSRCLLRERAEGAFRFRNRFAAGNKEGCMVLRRIVKRTGTQRVQPGSRPFGRRARNRHQNLAFVKLLETATRPPETGYPWAARVGHD